MAFYKTLMRKPALRAGACWLTARYIRLIKIVGRWSVEGTEIPEKLFAANQPFLVAFWHGRLLMMSEAWPYPTPFNMVVSQHRDGQLIARTIGHLGFGSILGSTTQGGSTVVRSVLRALKAGECVGLTPDGPQGPRMRASPGIVQMAKLAGVPIVPIAFAARPNKLIKSWDRLMVPLPFGRGVIRWGKPLEVARDADEAAVRNAAKLLEDRLNQLVHDLDDSLGLAEVEPATAEAKA
ncbi:MAG: lysophospholipid acyltransferase family protein [Proteobacteria bacterium]|nr:lysophospholipid acyltransferase family protein [Pseudomonadota bacterium]MDA1325333.1 lysophospholipid acyltransferase family protein [Pseudomonadota bacterium]